MHILESSDRGLRVAVIVLVNRTSPLRFLLLPMIHIGERAYYKAVATHVAGCQLAVMEGSGEKARPRIPGMIYRAARRLGLTRLVVQEIDAAVPGVPVVRPDLPLGEVRRRLGRHCIDLSWAERWLLLWILLFKPREALRTIMASLGQPRRMRPTDHVVLNQRDALLVDALSRVHRERAAEQITVAVVYGAAHMRTVLRKLGRRHGYRPEHVEWLTVFDLAPAARRAARRT